MRNVISPIRNLLIVGLLAGVAGLSNAYANTSAVEILNDIVVDDTSDTTITEDETATSDDLNADQSDELSDTTTPDAPPANDYGDALLNQLYNE